MTLPIITNDIVNLPATLASDSIGAISQKLLNSPQSPAIDFKVLKNRKPKPIKNTLYDLSKTIKDKNDDFDTFFVNLFKPFLSEVLKAEIKISNVSIDKFNRRFKVKSDVLAPVIELWEKGFKFVLAGGKMIDYCNCVLALESRNDFDLFFTSTKDGENLSSYLVEQGWHTNVKPHVLEFSKNDIQLQLIRRPFSSVEEVLQEFDMRTCSIACDGENIFWAEGSLKDTKNKIIRFQNVPIRTSQFFRIEKYKAKGYTIYAPDLALASIGFLASMYNDQYKFKFFTEREKYEPNNGTELSRHLEACDSPYTEGMINLNISALNSINNPSNEIVYNNNWSQIVNSLTQGSPINLLAPSEQAISQVIGPITNYQIAYSAEASPLITWS